MIASVLIEHNIQSLNKTFDYLIPNDLLNKIKIGMKVLVPFSMQTVEGFVLKIKKEKQKELEYKEIIKIVNQDFSLNEELIELGQFMSKTTVSNLISCYQMMLPKALKASAKTNVNKKYINYVILNEELNIEEYIKQNPRKNKEIEILNLLKNNKEIVKSDIKSSVLTNLINKKIVLQIEKEINREVFYINESKKEIKLTQEQQRVYEEIKNEKDNKNILLYGVTGSGKTEIYIKLIENLLKQNKTAILLVPEISLTPQIISRFKSVFSSVAILHSRLSEGEKYDEYRKIMNGQADVVIGARSAVFAPLKNIGIIIVDECGSASYKQDNNPKYNAIDIALQRSKYHDGITLLGSATPLLEQYSRGIKGVFKLVKLEKRINNTMPTIHLVDMSKEMKRKNFYISEELKNKIEVRLKKKEQVILLLNRRGYSTLISCSSCGYVYKCPNCDISLIYHKSSNNLRCHYCGYSTKKSDVCPKCKEHALNNLGLGTEKLETEIMKMFQNAKVSRMDTDTTSKKGSYEKIITDFKNQKQDILIGTQMVSKGLNFPQVTLVGIINADSSLNIPDFRSSERTFELLTQTSGRSGRNDLPGEVVIQTYNPDNYVLKHVKNYDFNSFYKEEMEIRRKLKYPPYFYIASIKISSIKYENARDESIKIKEYLVNTLPTQFTVLGPSTASILKLKNKYFFHILIKYKQEQNLLKILNDLRTNYNTNKISVDIDINPLNTM